MIWLQSHELYDSLVEYNHSDGSFTEISRKSNLGNIATLSFINGVYSILSSTFVAIYRFEGQLFIRIGDNCIPLSDEVVVSVRGENNARELLILEAGKEVCKINYELDASRWFEDDPTPFIDEETFDFGLFLSNISKSESRKRIIEERWRSE